MAGTFIKTALNGNYYVQVQTTTNASGRLNLYVYNTNDSAFEFVFDIGRNTWSSNYVSQSVSHNLAKSVSLELQTPLPTMLTFGVEVQGSNFFVYANGQQVGNSNTIFAIPNGTSTAGVGVDPGSSISIKNFAVYSE